VLWARIEARLEYELTGVAVAPSTPSAEQFKLQQNVPSGQYPPGQVLNISTTHFNFHDEASEAEASSFWVPIFADYNVAALQEGLNATFGPVVISESNSESANQFNRTGWNIAFSNRADDTYGGIWHELQLGSTRVSGVQLRFHVTIATAAGIDCAGIGGSPGASVWLKVGASNVQPLTRFFPEHSPEFIMNVDHGICLIRVLVCI